MNHIHEPYIENILRNSLCTSNIREKTQANKETKSQRAWLDFRQR